MPKRTREHELPEESVRAFAGALGSTLKFYERPQPEYGIDGDVEEFDAEGLATGLHFFVQLKATDEKDMGKALAEPVSMETASYYRGASMPVLMVRFHAPTNAVYVRWFHQYDPYYGRGGKESLTFRWQPEDVWSSTTPARLAAEARAFYEMRRAAIALPQPVHVISDGAFSLPEAELRLALRTASRERADIVRVESGPPQDGARWIEVRRDAIVAHLGTVTAATLHLDKDVVDDDMSAAVIANEALVLLALAFERVGQDSIASRLAATYLASSVLASDLDVAFALSSSMARSQRISEALTLADELDDPNEPELASSAFVYGLAALYVSDTLSEEEADEYETVLKQRVKRRKKSHPEDAGVAAMNVASYNRSRGRSDKAVNHYETARKLEPRYESRAHFWFEFAGALWMTRQYERSADAYARAIELGREHPLVVALYADALMFAGHYARALEELDRFLENDEGADDGEYRLKARALRSLIERLGIHDQRRVTGRVFKVAEGVDDGDFDALIELSRAQLEVDALWGSAWLNLALSEREAGRTSAALECEILSTILIPWDYEAWSNAIFAALDADELATASDLLVVGTRTGGDGLIEELVERSRGLPEELRGPFLAGVDEIQAGSRPGGPSILLRMLSEDGVVSHEISLDASLEHPEEDSAA